MMFLQRKAKAVPAMRRALVSLQMAVKAHEPGAPAVAGYESQSEGVLGILEKTEGEIKEELHDHEEAEASQAHYYDLEMLHLSDSIKQATAHRDEKASMKAQRASESGAAKGKLAATKTALADDEKMTAEIAATYKAKSAQYEENQKVRKAELEAIAKAIEIVSDPSVAGSYSEHVNLAQTRTSLLQIRSARSRVSSRQRVAAFLQRKAALLS